MSKQEYTIEQIEELQNNSCVKICSSKYITFTDEFKLKALELDKKYIIPKKIFIEFWFPDYLVNSEVPTNSLKRWRRKIKNKWIMWLVWTIKWRKKKEKKDITKMTKEEYIAYLETKTAYLEELHKTTYWYYP